MNNSESNQDNDQMIDVAWERLQKQLVKEPVNSQWARWSKQQQERKNVTPDEISVQRSATVSGLEPFMTPPEAAVVLPESFTRKNSWFKKHRKWVSGIAAASVLAVTLITPAGNQALAAILNKFHMQQMTVVKEDELQQMMNTIFTDGESREAVNKFGAISRKSGTINGEYTLKDAERLLNRKLIMPGNFDPNTEKVHISASNELTMTLKVDEVNKTLTRLGAAKLLPNSVDGKPITLKLGEAVSLSRQVQKDGNGYYYSFTQLAVPVIEVDPSIPVSEALEAVIQFPLLPDYIKNNLKTSGALDNGNIPLPIVTNGNAEKLTIQGVEAVLTVNNYGNKEAGNRLAYYNLIWIKNGKVYSVNGSGFADRAALVAFAEELIKQ
jgi:hypothetical protein